MGSIKCTRKRNSEFGDLFLVMVIIFAVAIFLIILSHAFSEVKPKLNDALINSKSSESGKNVTLILDQSSTAVTRFNVLYPLLIVGLFGFVMVSAMFLSSHPAFFFIGIVILGVALILGAIFSNIYGNIIETESFSATSNDFNIVELFMKNLPVIILLFFVAMAIVLWVKRGGGPSPY